MIWKIWTRSMGTEENMYNDSQPDPQMTRFFGLGWIRKERYPYEKNALHLHNIRLGQKQASKKVYNLGNKRMTS